MIPRVSFFAASAVKESIPVLKNATPVVQRAAQRFFSAAAHSTDYLRAQQEAFARRAKPVEVNHLPKGARFVGPNVQVHEPDLLDSVPLYERSSLAKLSEQEKEALLEMKKRYLGRLVEYEVREDIPCVTSKTEQGAPVHHVHHRALKMRYPSEPLEELLSSSTPTSPRR
ncbi:hypothetical protein [Legionella oakridgensis]|uniref:Uncharacterized protein n=2 Tax=Legionella oakridgensis TaxID=29423 RepID=W0BAS0_9GAMM|nr:hypothetical protein [Legionella oakridgensis]AHE66945.1 hypothetical protein Loa_01392 [Legionella oakridgensis ATCC 33761 = DSM 21215]ETO93400.1 hypothetical protein LOR_60c14210 [Legionella oakridgensis RV-2-2007]KTD39513.1 hypothetical protein Loak_0939 [Legionella oakridgensis]STY20051.1 Uncharacterised protein [Legionella longbeachae]